MDWELIQWIWLLALTISSPYFFITFLKIKFYFQRRANAKKLKAAGLDPNHKDSPRWKIVTKRMKDGKEVL